MENETAQVRILARFFFSSSSSSSFSSSCCLCMCGNVTRGLLIFCISLRVLLLFHNNWTNIRRCEQKILNKYNPFG